MIRQNSNYINGKSYKVGKSKLALSLQQNLITAQSKSALPSQQISQKLFISFQNTTKLPIYTSYSKMDEVKLVTIGLASANRIRQWAEKTLPNGKVVGEVTNANTLHHKTFKPQKGGLFCERIFGPLKDFECACGGGKKAKQLVLPRASQALPFMNKKEKDTKLQAASAADQLIQQQEKIVSNNETSTILGHTTSFGQMNNYKRFFCSKCDVEYTWSVIRRYQLGYIKLNAPVTHVWYVKGNPSYISLLLDMKKKHLEYVTYCAETLTLENSLKASATADDFTIGSELPKDLYALWEKAATVTTAERENQNLTLLNSQISVKEQFNHSSETLPTKNWYYFNSIINTVPSNTLAITDFNVSYGKTLLTKKVNKNLIIKTIGKSKLALSKNNKSVLQLLTHFKTNPTEFNYGHSNGKLKKVKALYNERSLISHKVPFKNHSFVTNLSKDATKDTFVGKEQVGSFHTNILTEKTLTVQTNLLTDPNIINANALVLKYEKFFANNKKNKHTLLLKNKESQLINSTMNNSLGVSLLKHKQFLSKAFCLSKKLPPNNRLTFLPLKDSALKSAITHSKEVYSFNSIYSRSALMQQKYSFLTNNTLKNANKSIENFENTTFGSIEKLLKLNHVTADKELNLRFNSLFIKMINLINFSDSAHKNNNKEQACSFYSINLAYLIALLAKRNNTLKAFNNIESYINKKMNTVKMLLLKSINLDFNKTNHKITFVEQNKKNKKSNMERLVNMTSLNLLRLIDFSKIGNGKLAFSANNLKSSVNSVSNQFRFFTFVRLSTNNNSSSKTNKYSISISTVMKLVRLIYLQTSSTQIKSRIKTMNIDLNHNLKNNLSFNSICNTTSVAVKELISQSLVSKITKSYSYEIEKSNLAISLQNTLKTLKFIQKKVVNVFMLNRMFIFLKKHHILKFGNISLFRSNFNISHSKLAMSFQTNLNSFFKKKINFLAFTNQKTFLLDSSGVSLFLTGKNKLALSFYSEQSNSKQVFIESQRAIALQNSLQFFDKTIALNNIRTTTLIKKQTIFEKLLPNKSKLSKLVSNNDQTFSQKPAPDLSYSSANKFLVNNIYCLSHRELWDQEKDWYFFAFYFFTAPELDDISVPVYEYRNYDFSLLNTFFSKEPSTSFSSPLITEKNNNMTFSSSSISHTKVQQNPLVEEKPNLHISYSGAGMIQALLAEFDYFELKKMDKQNRILLYDLNKYLKKLKKSLSLYSMAAGKMRLGNNKTLAQTKEFKDSKADTSLFNKNYSLIKKEFKEVCKQRDSLIRRTKFIRKVFRNYTGFSRSTSVDLYSNPNTVVQNTTDLNSHNSTSLDVGMNRLTSMVLTLLPVLPPDLRPIVKMGSQIAASDLNRLYQRVIYRNDRLKKFLKDPTTNGSFEMKYAQRLLQEAVDNLIQNGKSGVVPEKDARGRALKSLSDLLKGKQGRFRQYLLGKRVDYSGRSVIVVGPKLKLHECGLPKEMALELYLPFLIKRILTQNLARTVIGAKALIQNNKPLAWALLREIMKTCPVLLNRAPTLHRLGFQAFQPKLVDGRAILLHPLVCPAFNADFDGDQMAVHVPITVEARTEAWKLMLARNNLLSPATGEPLVLPSQDMVLGCYYLTNNGNLRTQKFEKGYGMYFDSFNEVLRAYYQGVVSTHAMVWVKWEGYFENPNADHLEQPIEIRINKYGVSYMIYPKHHSIYNKQNQLVKRMIRTTPGKILFNSVIQQSLT